MYLFFRLPFQRSLFSSADNVEQEIKFPRFLNNFVEHECKFCALKEAPPKSSPERRTYQRDVHTG